ncbi:MAG: hypothetical protein AAGC81_08015 [Pseudomonadota bacterium]
MKWVLLVPLIFLAACDEATVITHVDRDTSIDGSDLIAMQSGGGIPTVVLGKAFQGASSDELIAGLQPPAGGSQEIAWREISPEGPRHRTWMVLHFNPLGPPNPAADCRLTDEIPTGQPRSEGFEVTMSFCKDNRAEAHGHLKALKVQSGDFDAYSNVMRQLLNAIFAEAGSER